MQSQSYRQTKLQQVADHIRELRPVPSYNASQDPAESDATPAHGNPEITSAAPDRALMA